MARRPQTEEQYNAKRQQIIAAAIRVFAQRGFHATKIEHIAEAAGIGKGTIYEYFSSKDELFLAVYDYWMDSYEAAMQQAAEKHADDPLATADALIETAIAFYQEHAAYAPILLEFWAHALRSDNPHCLERIRKMKQVLGEIGARTARQLIAKGLFTQVDVESFAQLELGISDGIFLHWVLDGQQYSLRDAYRFRQAVIGAGLMRPTLRTLLKRKVTKRLKEGYLHSTQQSKS
ncbi:MAG: TetR/AcrR family transcriptional regulator [Bacteroidota bacterium]|nr:TetR/AcrR family transcriptional regulator [Candidatus Kapabacteria bacterium]MCS7303030.1 TetR/AcrR family transcriptional regulator [Candidatus Kapabacteria bacterium]MCX7936637.1 TetR/AcrR family transcriptional regulator [Chlorobiota bacterium]MDW8075367.1 TetR/AcrR family transcriptional regulator [Bacteroidota bacterium]MDW8272152.1 TetR/AcrR family transcriptional regulator [Bacteroidota bacterium]